jgi:hypothetical protein
VADDLIANCVCDVCGCRGLHACMGSRPKPMTEEEHARERMALRNAFEIIFQAEEMGRMRTDHADALARKDAEIAAMQRTMDMVNTSASFHVRRAEQAEARAERAEARVREAPVVEASPCSLPPPWVGNMPHATIAVTGDVAKRIGGKRVALVLLDTDD